jgi:regulator of sigma E protease
MFDFLNYIPLIGGLLTTVVPFVLVLSIVVAIHEFGHYIVGRWCGIHAEAFSLGFGPILVSRADKHGTKWQIAAIPLGGFVRFLGDADAASRPDGKEIDEALRHKTLNGAKLYKRALTVFAGPAANFILSAVIFAGLAYSLGSLSDEPVVGELAPLPQTQSDLREGDRILAINGTGVETFGDIVKVSDGLDSSTPILYSIERGGNILEVQGPFLMPALVGGVMPVSPASKAGLKAGDLFLSADGEKIHSFRQLVTVITGNKNESVNLKIWRNGQEIALTITPEVRDVPLSDGSFEKRLIIGVAGGFAYLAPMNSLSIVDASIVGVKRTYSVITDSINSIYQIFTGAVGAENLQGPLGIAQMSGDTASSGLLPLISLVAFISTAIGFLNLLPIPVLDGGHLVIYAFEAIFRRPPSAKAIQVTMTMGMTMLLSLMIFATFNDIMRL